MTDFRRPLGAARPAPVPLLDGDSAIGHLNNALQILALLNGTRAPQFGAGADASLTDVRTALDAMRRRIETAVRLLQSEGR